MQMDRRKMNGGHTRQPGSITLDERLHDIENKLDQFEEKINRLILLVFVGAALVAGATGLDVVMAVLP